MAIVWGAYVHAPGGYGMRVGIDVSFTPVTHTSKTSTATYKLYTQNDGTWDPPDLQQMEFDGNYSLPQIHEFENVGTSATNGDIIYRTTRTYTWTYSSSSYGSSSLPAEADLIVDVIHTRPLYYPHAEVHTLFPIRPYAAPDPPSLAAVSRVSDTSNRVVWINNATPGEPYTAIWLERYIYNYATWTRIATLGATVQSYTDTGAIPNRKYAYRVQADNTVGTSGYAQTAGVIYTAPAAPTSPVRTTSVATQVLSWALAVGYTEYQTEVWRSENGTYALLATLASGVKTYTDTTAKADKRTKYKFRTKTSSGPVLYSAYSAETTETAGIPKAPTAPTNLKPSSGSIDPTGPVTLIWTHNPTDGSNQTFFQVQYRYVGDATWTLGGKQASSASSWIMPANTVAKEKQVEWQVQTWGFSSTLPSPFSASAVWSTTPAVPLKYPLFLDLDTGSVEANSAVKLISDQMRRIGVASRTTNTVNSTAAYNICTFALPIDYARTGKRFRITAYANLVPDTIGMYTDLQIKIGPGASVGGTLLTASYCDHRAVNRSVGHTVSADYVFDPVTAGGENTPSINIVLVGAPGSGGGSFASQASNRPALLIVDEIISGSSTAGGGGSGGGAATVISTVDTATLDLTLSGIGSVDSPYLIKGDVIGGGLDQATADARYVNISGDTMTGALSLPSIGNMAAGLDLVLNSHINASGLTIWGVAAPVNDDWVATKKYVDDHAGSGSGGSPPSGIWGSAPLDIYGSNSLTGREIYVDSASKLRAKPEQVSGMAVTTLAPVYPPGSSIFYIPSGDTTWPTGSLGIVVTSKTSNNVAFQTCAPFTAVSTKLWYRNGTSTAWSPWVLVVDSTAVPAAPVSTAVSSYRQCTTGPSIPTTTPTLIVYDTASATQNDIPWSVDHFTIATAGLYTITAGHHFTANTTAYRTIRVLVNGSVVAVSQGAAAPTGGSGPSVAATRRLQPGDTVQIQVAQGTGANLVLAGGGPYNWVDITRVDGLASGSSGPDTGWKDATGLVAGWTVPSGYAGPQARQIGNQVRLRGSLTNNTFSGSYTTVASLPAGIGAPPYSIFPPLGGSTTRIGTVAIRDTGAIQFACNTAVSGAYFGIDSISYLTD